MNILDWLQNLDAGILLFIQEHMRIAGAFTFDSQKDQKNRIDCTFFHFNRFPHHECGFKKLDCTAKTLHNCEQYLPVDSKAQGVFISIRSCLCFFCKCIYLLSDGTKKVWDTCNGTGRLDCIFKAVRGSALSGRCSGRNFGSMGWKQICVLSYEQKQIFSEKGRHDKWRMKNY